MKIPGFTAEASLYNAGNYQVLNLLQQINASVQLALLPYRSRHCCNICVMECYQNGGDLWNCAYTCSDQCGQDC